MDLRVKRGRKKIYAALKGSSTVIHALVNFSAAGKAAPLQI
jgi:hypothetical protein